MEAYCVKCKSKREIQSPQSITMKNGRPATQGTCPVCTTKVFRIGAAKQLAIPEPIILPALAKLETAKPGDTVSIKSRRLSY